MKPSIRRPVLVVGVTLLVIVAGALLRGWLVPADRGDLAPEAYGWRLRLPWAPKAQVRVAYPAADGSLWVEVRRNVSEATPLAALRELAAGPAPDSGLAPALPEGMRIESVEVDGSAAVVTVAGWDPQPGDRAESAVLSAMSRTLAGQFPVGQLTLKTPSGRTIGPAPITDPFAGGKVSYLWQGLPVPVAAALPAGAERPAAAVKTLLTTPAPPGADSLPPGVSLLGVAVSGDTAKVSLGLSPGNVQELIAGRWQFAPYAMAVVHTLTEIPGIRRVQFDFPDLPAEARRQCRTPLGVPLVRPDAEASRGGSK